jgi:hypothetical protein
MKPFFHIPSINKALVALILISVFVNRLIHQRRALAFGRIELLILIHGLVTLYRYYRLTTGQQA